VCLNSEALGCVDVVVPFDERTPEVVKPRLRPEAVPLTTWGGQAVVLPFWKAARPRS